MIIKIGCCYRRLIVEEREEISRSLAKDESFQSIASYLGRSVSTIAREVLIRKAVFSSFVISSLQMNV